MSRIDEALKRTSTGEGAERSIAAERTPARIEARLESYPQEDRRPELRPVRPSEREPRGAVRTIAASRSATRALVAPDDESRMKLVIGQNAPASLVEQYRRLAATMHELQTDRGVKTLLLTSAVPKEGKTLNAINLALTLSESYARRVILIDADLRRPSVHRVLGLPNASGLVDTLRSDRGDVPVQHASQYLTVLTAGQAEKNPMALLTSERMTALLKRAAADYDWVILDTPPVGILPDASLLAGLADAILLVVAAGSTPYQLVQRAIGELGRDAIVGTIMNRIEGHRIPATDYYGSYGDESSTD